MRIACPFCSIQLDVEPTQAGMETNCPSCDGRFQIPVPTANIYGAGGKPNLAPQEQEFINKKIAAGICGIVLGGLGIHKFILGFNSEGAIMLSVYLVCTLTGCFLFIPVLGAMAMSVIGLVEGIMYLTKSDEEFYQTYAVERKGWF